MQAIRRILVPIDFSQASERALNYGLHLAEALEAELLLLHVLTDRAPSNRDREQADRDMGDLVPKAYRDLDCEVRTVAGEIDARILETVEASSADLVVMGSHGRRRFKRWFLGSVTERILRQIPVPVLTVSHVEESTAPAAGDRLRFSRILYPTDFSDSTEVGLPVAVGLAKVFQAILEIVHVVEHLHRSPTAPPYSDQELRRAQLALVTDARSRLESVLAQVDTSSVRVEQTVLEGQASQRLLAHIEDTRPDLVVMTLHGMSFLERALLGATAERVVRASTAPVLSVPRIER